MGDRHKNKEVKNTLHMSWGASRRQTLCDNYIRVSMLNSGATRYLFPFLEMPVMN